jgi:hypothetical protein
MHAIGSRGFLLTGEKPLPQSGLVEMRIAANPDLTLWATVVSSAPNGPGQLIECNCFALNGPTLSRWNDLFRAAARA